MNTVIICPKGDYHDFGGRITSVWIESRWFKHMVLVEVDDQPYKFEWHYWSKRHAKACRQKLRKFSLEQSFGESGAPKEKLTLEKLDEIFAEAEARVEFYGGSG